MAVQDPPSCGTGVTLIRATPWPGTRAFFVGVTSARPGVDVLLCLGRHWTGHRDGQDVALTEVLDDERHDVIVEAATERGADVVDELTAALTWRPAADVDLEREQAIVATSVATMTRHIDLANARDVLRDNLEHARWDDVASRSACRARTAPSCARPASAVPWRT